MKNYYIAQVPASNPPPSGQISISIEQVLLGSAVAIGGATIMVVKWFVGQSIKQYEQTISKLEGDIKRLKDEEIEELKGALHNQQRTSDSRSSDIERRFVELNTKFVDREDYLKHQTTTDLKLDALHKRLDEMMAIMLRNKP